MPMIKLDNFLDTSYKFNNIPLSLVFIQVSKFLEFLGYDSELKKSFIEYLNSLFSNGSDVLILNDFLNKFLDLNNDFFPKDYSIQNIKDVLYLIANDLDRFKNTETECKKIFSQNGIPTKSISDGVTQLVHENKILREAIGDQEAQTKKLYKQLEETLSLNKDKEVQDKTINQLKFKVKSLSEELSKALNTIADLKYDLSLVKTDKEGVWFWQGDGWDDPESLSCPVVISAETLRNLLNDKS